MVHQCHWCRSRRSFGKALFPHCDPQVAAAASTHSSGITGDGQRFLEGTVFMENFCWRKIIQWWGLDGRGCFGVRPKGWRLAGKWVGMCHIWKELDFNASPYIFSLFYLFLHPGEITLTPWMTMCFFFKGHFHLWGKTPSGPSGVKMMTPLCLNTSFGGKFILGFCAIGCMWFKHRSCASCKISSFYKHPSPKSNIYHNINRFNSIGKLKK